MVVARVTCSAAVNAGRNLLQRAEVSGQPRQFSIARPDPALARQLPPAWFGSVLVAGLQEVDLLLEHAVHQPVFVRDSSRPDVAAHAT